MMAGPTTPPDLIEQLVRLKVSLTYEPAHWLDDELSDVAILVGDVAALVVTIRQARAAGGR